MKYNSFASLLSMQKIYRRKNEDISKDYVCTEGCGKAYGSYAALYTHIKNKHGCIKPTDLKSNNPAKTKEATGKKGRPLIKIKMQAPSSEEVHP